LVPHRRGEGRTLDPRADEEPERIVATSLDEAAAAAAAEEGRSLTADQADTLALKLLRPA
jgi:hypothetical protein